MCLSPELSFNKSSDRSVYIINIGGRRATSARVIWRVCVGGGGGLGMAFRTVELDRLSL